MAVLRTKVVFEVQVYDFKESAWITALDSALKAAVFPTVEQAIEFLNWFASRRIGASLQIVRRTDEVLDLQQYSTAMTR